MVAVNARDTVDILVALLARKIENVLGALLARFVWLNPLGSLVVQFRLVD